MLVHKFYDKETTWHFHQACRSAHPLVDDWLLERLQLMMTGSGGGGGGVLPPQIRHSEERELQTDKAWLWFMP